MLIKIAPWSKEHDYLGRVIIISTIYNIRTFVPHGCFIKSDVRQSVLQHVTSQLLWPDHTMASLLCVSLGLEKHLALPTHLILHILPKKEEDIKKKKKKTSDDVISLHRIYASNMPTVCQWIYVNNSKKNNNKKKTTKQNKTKNKHDNDNDNDNFEFPNFHFFALLLLKCWNLSWSFELWAEFCFKLCNSQIEALTSILWASPPPPPPPPPPHPSDFRRISFPPKKPCPTLGLLQVIQNAFSPGI